MHVIVNLLTELNIKNISLKNRNILPFARLKNQWTDVVGNPLTDIDLFVVEI